MDEQSEAFFKLIFYMMIAPFWLAWKIIQLLWGLYKSLKEDIDQKSAQAQYGLESDAAVQAQKLRDEEREKQLAQLREAVPKTPLERMRATIRVNQIKVPRIERKRIGHLFTEDTFVDAVTGDDLRFAVDMILELTETDRAIIKQDELDDIVLENIPLYSEAEILRRQVADREEVKATKDLLMKEIKKNVTQDTPSLMKEARFITRVGDLVVSPYCRVFDSPHEAREFADKLKTKFLPEIRKLLDTYGSQKATETLEF
jgi:hypothetical protein